MILASLFLLEFVLYGRTNRTLESTVFNDKLKGVVESRHARGQMSGVMALVSSTVLIPTSTIESSISM